MKKACRLAVALTVINSMFLILILSQGGTTVADTSPQVLRARTIELVDDKGEIRSSLKVESNEEVVFRLTDAKGRIRVKLGASEEGSGLLLVNESTEPGVHILVKGKDSSLTLTGKGGIKRVIQP